MNDRGGAAFALVAAVVVVLAGTVVLVPDIADSASGQDQVDGAYGGPEEQYGLYQELTTCSPASAGYTVQSQSERTSPDRGSAIQLHSWRCPICEETKRSLGASSGDPNAEAANNLESHVRNSEGGGHGPSGTLPDEITPGVLRENVRVGEMPG